NDYQKSSLLGFESLGEMNALLDQFNSQWSRQNAIDFLQDPSVSNAMAMSGSEALSQWTNPELVVGGLSAGVGGFSTIRAAKGGGGTVDFVAGVEARSFGKVVGEGTVHVRPTINAIESGALKPRNAFGYLNKEGHTLLNGKPAGYWQEYHMLNFGSKSPLRILRGGQSEYFLSPDHYKSIIPLNR
ncbi:MAG: hypothetical protein ACK5L5_03565, partial [Bacteroidales bacterium]